MKSVRFFARIIALVSIATVSVIAAPGGHAMPMPIAAAATRSGAPPQDLVDQLKQLDSLLQVAIKDAITGAGRGKMTAAIIAIEAKKHQIISTFLTDKAYGVPISHDFYTASGSLQEGLLCVDDAMERAHSDAYFHEDPAVDGEIETAEKCVKNLAADITNANPQPRSTDAQGLINALNSLAGDVAAAKHTWDRFHHVREVEQFKIEIGKAKMALLKQYFATPATGTQYGLPIDVALFKDLDTLDQLLGDAFVLTQVHHPGVRAKLEAAQKVKDQLLAAIQASYANLQCQGHRQQPVPTGLEITVQCNEDIRYLQVITPSDTPIVGGSGPTGWTATPVGNTATYTGQDLQLSPSDAGAFDLQSSGRVNPVTAPVSAALGVDGYSSVTVTFPSANMQCNGQRSAQGPNGVRFFIICTQPLAWIHVIGPNGNTVQAAQGPDSTWQPAVASPDVILSTPSAPVPASQPAQFGVLWTNPLALNQFSVLASSTAQGSDPVTVSLTP